MGAAYIGQQPRSQMRRCFHRIALSGRPQADVCGPFPLCDPASPFGGHRPSRGLHHLRYSGCTLLTIIPAAMEATIISRVTSMTLCRSDRANSRAEREITVGEAALDSDRLSYSETALFSSPPACARRHLGRPLDRRPQIPPGNFASVPSLIGIPDVENDP
jgi:hypothetical protein